MKKLITLLLIASLTAFSQTTEAEETLKTELAAEHEGWKTGGVVNVNFSQAAFSTNWAAGGTNTMTMTGLVSIFENFSDGENIWDNNLELGYGFSKVGSADPVKSEDKIDLTSKYGRKAFKSWYYAGLFNFKSQMTPTDDAAGNKISEFLSPGAALFAVGMDYKPNDNLTAFISPITYKADMIMNDDFIGEDANGDPLRDNVESQIGGYLRVKYSQEVYTDINYESKFEAFSNYESDEETDQKPENVDLTWTNLLTMKVNEFLSANISFEMAHDDNVSKDSQFKEVLGIGLSYKF